MTIVVARGQTLGHISNAYAAKILKMCAFILLYWTLSVPQNSQFLLELSSRKRNNVRRRIAERIFAPKGGYCRYGIFF